MTVHFHPFSDFLIVVGMKAMGKTELTKSFCKALRRLIFIDPKWQLGELGYVVHFPERIAPAFQKFGKVIYQQKTPEALRYKTQRERDQILYREVFSTCLQFSNYTLGIDEIDRFARGKWYICPEFSEIINRGRIQGIGLIGNSRMPHMFHGDIRSSADHIICFKLHEERERKYMAEWIGKDHNEIKNLPRHHSFYYNVDKSTVTPQEPLY